MSFNSLQMEASETWQKQCISNTLQSRRVYCAWISDTSLAVLNTVIKWLDIDNATNYSYLTVNIDKRGLSLKTQTVAFNNLQIEANTLQIRGVYVVRISDYHQDISHQTAKYR